MSTTETPAAETAAQQRPKAERVVLPLPNGSPAIFECFYIINKPSIIKEFNEQLSLLRNQLQRIVAISQRREQALTTAEKDALAKVHEQEVRDFQGKDSLFSKVYGFRAEILGLRPIDVLESARLMAAATDEELAKARSEKEFKETSVVSDNGRNYLQVSEMYGMALKEFLRSHALINTKRNQLVDAKTRLESMTGEDKAKLEEAIKAHEEQLIKDNEAMAKTYGFSLGRDFRLEVLGAKYFFALTQEDIQRAAAQQQAEAAEAPKAEAKKEKAAKAN